ncbi:thiamine diphosphokinase [Lactococcus allomyrinae]|uniref:Thiamine diphosphokinase n=1 Tax=Lactococcus allomyrinae TaxID=2419773 RepID=A0A387BF41_9LACT|nr:thiamine diphosphokinase [Lactococcus allomyrinae]AYG00874.1 thiamine diphosphokinase [Lactococcus allomyrinae]
MKILIVAGLAEVLPNESFDRKIGVDRGSLFLIENGQEPDLAVGDFDSVSADEFEKISVSSKEIVKLPVQKDKTDLEVALDWVLEKFPEAELTIIGSLGGRLDHLLTNVFLPTRPQYQTLAEKITVIDQQNLVRYLLPGRHILYQIEPYRYIGFMQVESADTLAIEGAKYPLKAEENFSQIYASNEFISNKMTVSLDQGMVIVIYSRDRKEIN